MKIGIITFHRAINYGAVLQAFALYKTVETLGEKVEIIDYVSPAVSAAHHRMTLQLSPVGLYRFLRFGKSINRRFDKFEKFLNSMQLSPSVSSPEDIAKLSADYGAVICGSDQVWNLNITEKDFNYFLKTVNESTKRIAYAASFGQSDYPADLKDEIKTSLERFDSISVREKAGKEIVESLLNMKPKLVLDPTLLLTKQEWRTFSEPYEIRDKYLLVYSVGQIEDLFDLAREIAHKRGYKIAVISLRKFKDLPNAMCLKDLSPLEFVNVVDNAECVITNSFHGTAFSVELEKKFIVVRRSEKAHPGLNSRMETLLEKVGLIGQIYGEKTTNVDELLSVDHSQASQKLSQFRTESKDFLRSSLI